MKINPATLAEDLEGQISQPAEPEAGVQETAVETADAVQMMQLSLDFLAGIALPVVFKYFFPPVLLAVWDWLTSNAQKVRAFPQLALGLPRGFGKTMLVKLFIFYCILFTKKQFILIIAGTETKAKNILSDVIKMLEEPNIKNLFGDWKLGIEIDRQDLKKFGFRGRNIIIMAAGAGSDIRGSNLEFARPDLIIFDDIQTAQDAQSPTVSASLEDWFYGTALKSKSPEGCMFIFIANMYPTEHSMLRKLKNNPTWTSFIAGGILADGTSLWEDLQPIAQLKQEYLNDCAAGKAEIFHAEVLNDENASLNTVLSISDLPENPYELDTSHQGNYIVIDPSNDKANSDAVAIGCFEVYDAKPVLAEVIEERLSPGDIIRKTLIMALQRNCRLIFVEANAYQYSLLYWFGIIVEQHGLAEAGFVFEPIYSGSRSKNARILDTFKSLLAGELYLKEQTRPAVHAQIRSFNPLSTKNVDNTLDLLTYGIRILSEFKELVASTMVLNVITTAHAGVPSVAEASPF